MRMKTRFVGLKHRTRARSCGSAEIQITELCVVCTIAEKLLRHKYWVVFIPIRGYVSFPLVLFLLFCCDRSILFYCYNGAYCEITGNIWVKIRKGEGEKMVEGVLKRLILFPCLGYVLEMTSWIELGLWQKCFSLISLFVKLPPIQFFPTLFYELLTLKYIFRLLPVIEVSVQ